MNVLIEGRRGLGKSTLAEFVALSFSRDVLFFDPNNQFKHATIRTSDIEVVKEALDNEENENQKEGLSLAYILPIPPEGSDQDYVEDEWNKFARAIWEYGDYSLIIDESHRLQKAQYVNRWLDTFMRQAPRRERNDPNPIDIIQTFHRPVDVNGIVTGLSDEVYVFRTTKSRDLETLEKEFGVEFREAVTTLRTPATDPAGRDVARYFVERESFEIITDPKSWYVDIRNPKKDERPPWAITKLEAQYGKL